MISVKAVCDTTLSGQPRLINFFKLILFLASDSSRGFRRGISHFFTATKLQPREWKEEQTNNMDLGQFKAKERELCVTISCSFSCICWLSWACIFRNISTKAIRNANSSLTVFPYCLLLWTVLPLDCYRTPTSLFCSPLSTAFSLGSFVNWPFLFSRTSLSSSTSGLAGDLELKPFFWISCQNTKRSSARRTHPHSATCVNFLKSIHDECATVILTYTFLQCWEATNSLLSF